MENEKQKLAPEERWILSQCMIDAFRQPSPLSPEMQNIMNRNLPDEKIDVKRSTLKQLFKYVSKPFKHK